MKTKTSSRSGDGTASRVNDLPDADRARLQEMVRHTSLRRSDVQGLPLLCWLLHCWHSVHLLPVARVQGPAR